LTKPSAETNRPPIVVIFSLISIETVFKRLSKVRLLGSSNGSDNPHDFITFLLNCKSVEKDNDAMTCWNQGETRHTYNKTSKDYGGRV